VSQVPAIRLAVVNDAPVRRGGDFVLYWMVASRRPGWSFALDRAVEWASALEKPLLVLEALRAGYPWASDRLHRFVLQGMAANRACLAAAPVHYHPYVEPAPGEGKGLLAALGARACVVVTDDFPAFFLPRAVAAAGERLGVRLEKVDGNGLLPLRAADRLFTAAHSFRRFLGKELPPHLEAPPREDPFDGVRLPALARLPPEVEKRWPAAPADLLAGSVEALARLPIDHAVEPVDTPGGADAARAVLADFIERKLDDYPEARNHPDRAAQSGLSPYLHFGHLATHQTLAAITRRERWTPARWKGAAAAGRRGGWGLSEAAEAFLDELVTWRELGCNMCCRNPGGYDRYDSLPGWARETLERHARDTRPAVYSLAELESAGTHDELWNAAQTELLREGRIHNYLRMLWGKKILEWSPTPREALAVMIELNNRFAVDGRDPNSYAGIFWCLGRYDRPWPERPIFGTVRYMSSENTARKHRVREYVQRFSCPTA
jgi:deoxyribodipyrimidine photo-lyase